VHGIAIRPDLLEAQAAAWRHVTSPGASWSGVERAAIASATLAALDDTDPVAPWVSPSDTGRQLAGADVVGHQVADTVYRIARHAASVTEPWYRAQVDSVVDPFAYVELVGIVSAVAAVHGFHRAAGTQRPPLPIPDDAPAHGRHPVVEPATLNWVPVAVPADQVAAVVQGLSAAPAEWDNVKRLAAAQYIPVDEMSELGWTRGTLTRSEMELLAARLSAARQCFF
jgi:hypothetical protein